MSNDELGKELENLTERQILFTYFGCIIQALLESRQQYGAVGKSVPWSLSTLLHLVDIVKNADIEDKNVSFHFIKVSYH